jgi:PQQ-dependent catabolism-associated CXXCW motif protein
MLALIFAMSQDAQAKRIALVIGNDNYQYVSKLQKAGNDATAMGVELRAAGFEVLLHRDLNYAAMVQAVDTLTKRITGGDEVVVFFAGHGVQIKTGSYLLPVDINATSEVVVDKTSYALTDLLDQLALAKATFSLVMIDACRDNPLKSQGRSVGSTRGLSPPDPPKGQMVVYSASKGQQALDRLSENDSNQNSVFTREFIARMKRPGLRIEDLVREVQDSVEVLASTVSHEQRPALYNEARGNFYFFAPKTNAASSTSVSKASLREDRFWDEAKSAGNREGFEAYRKAYPDGRYADLALANLSKLAAQTQGQFASSGDATTGTAATSSNRTATPAVALQSFGFEDKDWGVAPRSSPKTGSAHAPTPVSIPGGRVIKTLELKDMLATSKNLTVVDVLDSKERRTVPGAHWLPDAGDTKMLGAEKARLATALEKLTGGDKDRTLVFMCINSECWQSYNSSLHALEFGYRNVVWYRGGTQAWVGAGLELKRARKVEW